MGGQGSPSHWPRTVSRACTLMHADTPSHVHTHLYAWMHSLTHARTHMHAHAQVLLALHPMQGVQSLAWLPAEGTRGARPRHIQAQPPALAGLAAAAGGWGPAGEPRDQALHAVPDPHGPRAPVGRRAGAGSATPGCAAPGCPQLHPSSHTHRHPCRLWALGQRRALCSAPQETPMFLQKF